MCVWLHSETQRELEDRTHEVLDMDNALKERQGELQKRAQLVTHTHKVYFIYCSLLMLFVCNLLFLFYLIPVMLSWVTWKWASETTSRRWRGRWILCSRTCRPERASWETHSRSSQTEPKSNTWGNVLPTRSKMYLKRIFFLFLVLLTEGLEQTHMSMSLEKSRKIPPSQPQLSTVLHLVLDLWPLVHT